MRAALLLLLCAAGAGAQISPGPLSRAHADLEGVTRCTKCHPLGGKSMDLACLDCHREIAWLREKSRGLHAAVADQECSHCHPDHAGVEFELVDFPRPKEFDHARAGWPLEGAHVRLDCEGCHRPELQKLPMASLRPKERRHASYLGLDTRCVACHVDDHQQQLGIECRDCHGMESFAPAAAFDHATTSFPLRGRHRQVECALCHTQRDPDGQSIVFPKRAVEQCSSCHQDVHQGRFGANCRECHVEEGWTAKLSQRFDHSRTRFALLGAHSAVSCERCHEASAGGWGKKPAFDRCARCHDDPHQAFEVDCADCHDARAFAPSQWKLARHETTRFPLLGAHRQVACKQCHGATIAGSAPDAAGLWWKLADLGCASCHRDAHGTQELRDDCTSCHGNEQFRPSSFDAARHGSTDFALEGQHLDARCAACHAAARAGLPAPAGAAESGSAAFVFELSERACADCHRDPHAAGKRSQDCASCHGLAGWAPATIGPDEHARHGVELDGSHAALPCVDCHPNYDGRASAGETLLLSSDPFALPFATRARQCEDCHRDGQR